MPTVNSIINGAFTVGTTAMKLSEAAGQSTQGLSNGVTIKADTGIAGTIYVGGVGVTTATGFPLTAGQAITLESLQAQTVYVIASQAAQTGRFIGT